jgi:aryl-alcohol dehydrogenase-like predicted oxidoreductase
MHRRNFIQYCSAIAGIPFTAGDKIPKIYFGASQNPVSVIGFGAGELYRLPEKHAVQLVQTAYAHGVNLYDAAAAYGEGLSEQFLGTALRDIPRDDLFIISKTLGRTIQHAQQDLRSSLHRLQTDYLNVWMIHDLRNKYELEAITSPGGALQTISQAKVTGTARYTGLSANRNPELVLKAINHYPFDVLMIPITPDDGDFVTKVLPQALKMGIRVIGIRVLGLPKKKERDAASIHQSINRALSYPITSAVTGCEDQRQLLENLGAVR